MKKFTKVLVPAVLGTMLLSGCGGAKEEVEKEKVDTRI